MMDLTKSSAQLKASILQDAMMGKLTKQLPEDGVAKDLLTQINSEKSALIKAKKIKKQKALPEIEDDEIPFEIPDNWQWVRLGEIVNLVIGKTPSRHNSEYWNGNIPWVSVRDMNNGLLTNTNEGITSKAEVEKFNNNIIPKGTMLMSFKLSIGKVCILGIPAYHNEAIVSFNFYKYPDTIQNYLFRTIHFLTRFAKSKNAIQGKTLNKTSLNNMLIPFPPLSEQKRIIQKLDSLLPKVDEFNHSVEQLHSLREELLSRLSRSFLQSAMMGKLTKQLPEDGDASELLEQIKAKKDALVKAKKIKSQNPLPEIDADEIPFEIPDNWRWVRLGNLTSINTGLSYKKGSLSNNTTDLRIIRGGNISNDFKLVLKDDDYRISNDFIKNDNVILKENQLITPVSTSPKHTGKVGIVPNSDEKIIAGGFIYQITPFIFTKVFSKFLMYALSNPKIKEDIFSITNLSGSALYNIPKTKFINILIPLPPFSEQKRIVDKIDRLFEKLRG